MNLIRKLAALIFTVFALGVSCIAQATIISVDGAGDTGQVIDVDEAVAISFTLTDTFTDVSIGAPVACFACTGGVWLHSNVLGPGGSFGDSLGAQAFDNTSTSPFFSGLTLNAGLYFLIVSIDSGFAIWEGSLLPDVMVDASAALGLEFRSSNLDPFVPFSDFGVLFAEGSLHYTVSSGAVAVAEPGTLALLAVALFGIGLARRRRDLTKC